MTRMSRRSLTLGLLSGAALAATGTSFALRKGERALVIGAGPAGALAASKLAASNPGASVTLIERDPTRMAREPAPATAFDRPASGATLSTLAAAGVQVKIDEVTGVDWRAGRAALFSGRAMAFDRLVLAPGIAPKVEKIAGLDARARHAWPAAWGNAREARRLSSQLAALRENGHVVLRLPAEISHPHVAMTRALALARAVAAVPGARLTVLDESNDPALRQGFAMAAGLQRISRNVAWLTPAQGARVTAVDADRGLLLTDAGEIRADVVNFIAPQQAGVLAQKAGLTDASGWCPCDDQGRSARVLGAVVLGDARKSAARTVACALASAQALPV
ncbi:pyridine nucleotide-disulfide oxidoreductase [Rhodobacter aestuarii]|uniref:Pyridine nucleotide-disulphide oxidoreductase n=1 Tax=Rhodobacter aestuarii TaxID=453582 RepID=A0A1N7J8B3_9RHOB|nr:FAD-dependent oxidoreductase [Rhodobacter aestuarii]PTV97070.1 pyridine nucleotide-disulfide oxidoreductase [Rhodobacter aestuarii]SIS45628.1 Pyridine nucleotide-disulphide oxidoreductase [Rhodobacter aestuarii]